ncbi:MAG: hypothetical protein K2L42_04205 [Clostridia bacterium]|nr:hypothetical protein [Clostridia bacterium]
MKRFLALLTAFVACCGLCVCAACSESDQTDGENPPSAVLPEPDPKPEPDPDPKPEPEPKPDATKYTAQLARAQELYGEIYAASERKGGLFGDDVAYGAHEVSRASVNKAVTRSVTAETVKEIIKKYYTDQPSSKTSLNSYVTDIFTYMQVQTAILNEYELGSLINTYEFTYDGLDLEGVNLGGVAQWWFKKVLPTKASFPGADLDTGRIYCEHSHISGSTSENVDTELEYYCDDNGGMGVTTLNLHYKNDGSISKFEYDFFDFTLGYVLVANGTVDGGGNIRLNVIMAYTMEYSVATNKMTAEDKQIIYSHIYSETERIYGKIAELKERNAAVESELGVEKDEIAKKCNVIFDFDALQSMLIK